MELSALQDELDKEKQALENALTKAQMSEEKEQENNKLLSQLKQVQVKYLLSHNLPDIWHVLSFFPKEN